MPTKAELEAQIEVLNDEVVELGISYDTSQEALRHTQKAFDNQSRIIEQLKICIGLHVDMVDSITHTQGILADIYDNHQEIRKLES